MGSSNHHNRYERGVAKGLCPVLLYARCEHAMLVYALILAMFSPFVSSTRAFGALGVFEVFLKKGCLRFLGLSETSQRRIVRKSMGGCCVCGSLFNLLCIENPLIGRKPTPCFLGCSCFFRYICRCENWVCAPFTLMVEVGGYMVVFDNHVCLLLGVRTWRHALNLSE